MQFNPRYTQLGHHDRALCYRKRDHLTPRRRPKHSKSWWRSHHRIDVSPIQRVQFHDKDLQVPRSIYNLCHAFNNLDGEVPDNGSNSEEDFELVEPVITDYRNAVVRLFFLQANRCMICDACIARRRTDNEIATLAETAVQRKNDRNGCNYNRWRRSHVSLGQRCGECSLSYRYYDIGYWLFIRSD